MSVSVLNTDILKTILKMKTLSNVLNLVGQSYINLYRSFLSIASGQINIKDTIFQASTRGVDSIIIILITCTFIGMALALHMTNELIQTYGAETAVGGLVSLAIARELAPVVTAIVIAGRVGASITAEIGSMKVTEQIDALRVMDIDPVEYLIVPRLVAGAAIAPLLTVIAAISAILSAMYLSYSYKGLGCTIFLESIQDMLTPTDVFVAILKASTFGILIVTIASTFGLNVTGGADAVGNYTTRTVVWSLVVIFIANYFITSIFYGV
jgi:phospholipid/cholesterol/gamma-HCH transport system permease protein